MLYSQRVRVNQLSQRQQQQQQQQQTITNHHHHRYITKSNLLSTPPPSPMATALCYPNRSCMSCKRRKVKCDRKTPSCTACTKSKHSCQYTSYSPSPLIFDDNKFINNTTNIHNDNKYHPYFSNSNNNNITKVKIDFSFF